MRAGRLYSLITRHWLKVAPALVVTFAVLEFVVGGLTANSRLEYYVFAWASVTSGLWFLFDRAEQTASDHMRNSAANWINSADLSGAAASLPQRFASLFDQVFGGRHFSWRCFRRSAVASVFAAVVTMLLFLSTSDLDPYWANPAALAVIWLAATPLIWNVLPDYLSLLETRYLLGLLKRSASGARVALFLILDTVATTVIALTGFMAFLFVFTAIVVPGEQGWTWFSSVIDEFHRSLRMLLQLQPQVAAGGGVDGSPVIFQVPLGVFFYSTFFTSAWLWLYVLAALVSRVLVRLGGGVGLLLRATDVEQQPFRSLGFTSIVLVSIMFLFGLPVLLL